MTRRVGAVITTAIPIAVFVIDRITKRYFISVGAIHELPLPVVPNVIDVTQHHNYGLIANLPVPSWIIISFTTLILAAIGWKIVDDLHQPEILKTGRPRGIAPTFALALIAGGAIGNLFDRITMGYVFDWILLFNRSVINVADIAIGAGILWYLIAARRKISPPS